MSLASVFRGDSGRGSCAASIPVLGVRQRLRLEHGDGARVVDRRPGGDSRRSDSAGTMIRRGGRPWHTWRLVRWRRWWPRTYTAGQAQSLRQRCDVGVRGACSRVSLLSAGAERRSRASGSRSRFRASSWPRRSRSRTGSPPMCGCVWTARLAQPCMFRESTIRWPEIAGLTLRYMFCPGFGMRLVYTASFHRRVRLRFRAAWSARKNCRPQSSRLRVAIFPEPEIEASF